MEFSTKYPTCKPDVMDTFLTKIVQPLFQYCGQMKVLYLANLVTAPNQSNIGILFVFQILSKLHFLSILLKMVSFKNTFLKKKKNLLPRLESV